MPTSTTLALIDDDKEFVEYLSQYLRGQGMQVHVFADSNDLLTDERPYRFDFYVIDLSLPGVDGVELIKILRRRTAVGILVVSGRLSTDVFKEVIHAGADMYLAKPVQFEQVALAVMAIQRRVGTASPVADTTWKLNSVHSELVAPDGTRIELSSTDLVVMLCFLDARGETVSRETLLQRLGRAASTEPDDGLNATIYRLRRRIERATPIPVPLQSKSRIGYVFRASLVST